MHVITRRRIREFSELHPTSAPSLAAWYKVMSGSEFGSLAELRRVFASADLVAGKTVWASPRSVDSRDSCLVSRLEGHGAEIAQG
jgi:mRNA-degrading endonuclease HigB of HigAB toxin-antitoxin module